VGDLPFPNEPSPPDSSAYAKDDTSANTPSTALAPSSSSSTHSSQNSPMLTYPYLNEPPHSILLTHSNDLGRLPVHLMSSSHPLTPETPLAHAFSSPYPTELSSFLGAPIGTTGQPNTFEANSSTGFATIGIENAWATAGRRSVSQVIPPQFNLAQLLNPPENQQQPFFGGDDTWSNVPLGFRYAALLFLSLLFVIDGRALGLTVGKATYRTYPAAPNLVTCSLHRQGPTGPTLVLHRTLIHFSIYFERLECSRFIPPLCILGLSYRYPTAPNILFVSAKALPCGLIYSPSALVSIPRIEPKFRVTIPCSLPLGSYAIF
jgi:hypothetical protein